MFNPTNSNDIFKALGDMNKANAYDVLVKEFQKLKEEKVRLEQRNEVLTKALEDLVNYNKDNCLADEGDGYYNRWQSSQLSDLFKTATVALNQEPIPDDLKDLNTFNI